MRKHQSVSFALLALAVALLSSSLGCGSGSAPSGAQAAVRLYNGTAAVGDFLSISIDSKAGTITYSDVTNGETGTVPYTVNGDGTYSISDPQGNILTGYEVPGFVLLVEAAKAGSGRNTPALITAVESTPVTIEPFAGKNYNFMQFRTAAGGIEIGSVSIDAQGNITHNSYSPMALIWGNNQYFNSGSFPASSVVEDSSGNFFTINETDSSKDVVFGAQNGLWAVDTGIGTILGLPKAASKFFDPASTGTYKGILYEKAGAQMGMNNTETGTPTQGTATVTISSVGAITITDGQGNQLAAGTLVAVADSSYLYDGTAGKLSDPCNGLFTVRTASSSSQQDVFVAFESNAVIFGSFQSAMPGSSANPYTYFYGVALK